MQRQQRSDSIAAHSSSSSVLQLCRNCLQARKSDPLLPSPPILTLQRPSAACPRCPRLLLLAVSPRLQSTHGQVKRLYSSAEQRGVKLERFK